MPKTSASRTDRPARPPRWSAPSLRIFHDPNCRSVAEIPIPEPAVLEWEVDGRSVALHFWTPDQFRRIPASQHPADLVRLGNSGFVVLVPRED